MENKVQTKLISGEHAKTMRMDALRTTKAILTNEDFNLAAKAFARVNLTENPIPASKATL